MDAITLLDGAAPFYSHGSDVSCLLIHGLTSTPNEMRWLGQHLRQQGFTVCEPRLAGHGTTPSDLARVTWREWYADVLAGYRMLRRECGRVFVMGRSMGGALALLLAACEADETVSVENLRYIWEAIGSQDKERLILGRSGHVIIEDCEHQAAFEAISTFVVARL